MRAGSAATDRIESEGASLGRALKIVRIRAGVSQEEAGQRFGISGQGWGQYELGCVASIFRPTVQRRLAEALGVTVADLLAEHRRIVEPSEGAQP